MKTRKIIASTAVALSLLGVSTPVMAATTTDTWEYGYGAVTAYSNYYAGKSAHGSKVVNRNNGTTATGYGVAGQWSRASIYDLWDPASFYYKSNGGY